MLSSDSSIIKESHLISSLTNFHVTCKGLQGVAREREKAENFVIETQKQNQKVVVNMQSGATWTHGEKFQRNKGTKEIF